MSPEFQKKAKELQKRIRQADPEELSAELKKQINHRFTELFEVVKTLNSYEYSRTSKPKDSVWQEGSTKLLHYKQDGQTLLFIPSLINRSYILDLAENRSMIKYLQKRGYNCYLVDWNEPETDELDFALDDYIQRLNCIIDKLHKENGKIVLVGYCMGGLLSLASAIDNQDKIKGISLFATPWDFHVKEFSRFKLDDETVKAFSKIIDNSDKISASIIQAAFYYLHASLIERKFETMFAIIKEKPEGLEELLALEHWANDGISMTRKVAKECFIDWVHHNDIKKGKWLDINKLDLPTFMASATKDHIVPKSSSQKLADILTNVEHHVINGGHISIVAGSTPKNTAWKKMDSWINNLN